MTDAATTGWFRLPDQAPTPQWRLVCFPHAGGAANAYRSWSNWLPAHAQVCPVRYPGRMERINEPCYQRMAPLVADLCAALVPLLTVPVYLFGHSLGASIAFEVASRLEHHYGRPAAGLFVSGSKPPHRLVPKFFATDQEVIANTMELGGADPALFEDPELRSIVLPPLRADYQLLDTYRPTGQLISAPIVAYGGDGDPEVPPADLPGWSELTRGAFTSRVFTGGHFFLVAHESALVTEIRHRIEAPAGPSSG